MYAAPFDYARPTSLDEAISLLSRHGDEAKLLAGGHSLIPAMKLRLAQPKVVIDIARLEVLRTVEERGDRIAIGALVTHAEIAANRMLAARCPLLGQAAATIGDVQVRNKGTLGGSLVHADPAADWPATVLALDAELEIAGPQGRRTVRAGDFFVGMLETAVGPNEIVPDPAMNMPAPAPMPNPCSVPAAPPLTVVPLIVSDFRYQSSDAAPRRLNAIGPNRPVTKNSLVLSTTTLGSDRARSSSAAGTTWKEPKAVGWSAPSKTSRPSTDVP